MKPRKPGTEVTSIDSPPDTQTRETDDGIPSLDREEASGHTDVPLKRDWMRPFLNGYTDTGTVDGGCRRAGICRATAYVWRNKDEAFASAWDDADEAATDRIEETIIRKALAGHVVACIFVLKGRRPEKYRDNYDVGKILAEIQASKAPAVDPPSSPLAIEPPLKLASGQ